MSFSYTSFLSNTNNQGNSYSQGTNAQGRKPSDAQVKFYNDLCERKGKTPADIAQFNHITLGDAINELQKLPDGASARQKEKIVDLQKELVELGSDINPITDEVMQSLTGGRNGSASALINKMMTMRTELNETASPSQPQLQILVEWFLCPDIPFEEFNVSKKIYLERLGAVSSDNAQEVMERRLWRLATPDEFANSIKNNMTKRQASKFIDDHRGSFYEWRQTRTTQKQMEYIRELESRLADTYVPAPVEFAVVDGELVEIRTVPVKAQYSSPAYEPLAEIQLAQMSYEQASEWIDRLKSEVARKNDYQPMYNEADVFGDNQQEFENNRHASDEESARALEMKKFHDLIFAVEAMTAVKSDEIHDMANELVLEAMHEEQHEEYKMRLRDFFLSTVTADRSKDEMKWAKEMARIYGMCEDVPLALSILPSPQEIMAR